MALQLLIEDLEMYFSLLLKQVLLLFFIVLGFKNTSYSKECYLAA